MKAYKSFIWKGEGHLRMIILLAVFPWFFIDTYSQAQYSCGEKKVFVCHKGKNTLCVSEEAVKAHLDHGDFLGPCETKECDISVTSIGGEKTCANPEVTLHATSSSAGVIFNWSGPDNYSSGFASPVVSLTGAYTVTVTDTITGCMASSGTMVTSDQVTPQIRVSVSGMLSCKNNSVTITADSDIPKVFYKWTGPNNFASSKNKSFTSFPGEYKVLAINPDNGCSSTSTIVVQSNYNVPEGVTASSEGELTCLTQSIKLSGSSGTADVNFHWKGPGNFISMDKTTYVSVPGNYVLTVANVNNGCETSTNVTVFRNLIKPEISAHILGELNCNVSHVVLKGICENSGIVFSWSGPDNFTFHLPETTVAKPGKYVLKATDPLNGCISYDTVEVKQNISLPANLVANVSGKISSGNSEVTISASSNTNNLKYSWSHINGFNFSGSVAKTNIPGEYILSATNPLNGCSDTKKVVVTKEETP